MEVSIDSQSCRCNYTTEIYYRTKKKSNMYKIRSFKYKLQYLYSSTTEQNSSFSDPTLRRNEGVSKTWVVLVWSLLCCEGPIYLRYQVLQLLTYSLAYTTSQTRSKLANKKGDLIRVTGYFSALESMAFRHPMNHWPLGTQCQIQWNRSKVIFKYLNCVSNSSAPFFVYFRPLL